MSLWEQKLQISRYPFSIASSPIAPFFEKWVSDKASQQAARINFNKILKDSKFLVGWFDQVEVTLHLKRDIRYYTMEYYLPVIGMVMISFVSFWIHFQATPARVALPTTTLLTMNKMIHHIRSSSLLYGNAEALEIFLNTSMVFVTAVLLEYGIVGLTNKRWSQVWACYHKALSTFKMSREFETIKQSKVQIHIMKIQLI